MKSICWFLMFSLFFLLLDCAEAGTQSLNVRYQSVKPFPSLQQKMGATLAIAPLKDERPDTSYIGIHTTVQGDSIYFRSRPFPLDEAIKASLSETLSRYGVKAITIPSWDGKPDAIENMESDSIMMIQIKRFWTEGKAALFRTKIKTVVQFVIHLGVKKEGKVFTKNVEVEKEMTVARSTPERVEAMMNQILTEIFDAYFSNSY